MNTKNIELNSAVSEYDHKTFALKNILHLEHKKKTGWLSGFYVLQGWRDSNISFLATWGRELSN